MSDGWMDGIVSLSPYAAAEVLQGKRLPRLAGIPETTVTPRLAPLVSELR